MADSSSRSTGVEGSAYWVYILSCSDKSLYCGSTSCLERRMMEHNKGIGAKYTQGRAPLTLERAWQVETRSHAQMLESMIKKCPKAEKIMLVNEPELLLAKAKRKGLEFTIKVEK